MFHGILYGNLDQHGREIDRVRVKGRIDIPCQMVAVHNPGQQEELINNAIHILPFLRQHLNNSRIQMRVRIVEGNEKHLAYTSTEKLELLMKINPTLGRLRDEFNLTLD